jgi:hypothetical protein
MTLAVAEQHIREIETGYKRYFISCINNEGYFKNETY